MEWQTALPNLLDGGRSLHQSAWLAARYLNIGLLVSWNISLKVCLDFRLWLAIDAAEVESSDFLELKGREEGGRGMASVLSLVPTSGVCIVECS